jgi:hypothetical protein
VWRGSEGGDENQEKSLDALAATVATPVGAIFFSGGGVEVLFPFLPSHLFTREKSQMFRLGGSNGVLGIVTFLKALLWVRGVAVVLLFRMSVPRFEPW